MAEIQTVDLDVGDGAPKGDQGEDQGTPLPPPPADDGQQDQGQDQGKPAAPEAGDKAKPPDDAEVAARFAAATKREGELWRRDQDLNAREAKLAELEAKVNAATEDPLALLQAFGHSPSDVYRRVVEGKKEPSETEKLAAELADLRQWKQEQEEKASRAAAEAEAARLLTADIEAIKGTVEKAGDKYEQIATEEAWDLVADSFYAAYEQTGRTPDLIEIMDRTERYLVDRAKTYAGKALKTKKVSSLLQQAQGAAAADGGKPGSSASWNLETSRRNGAPSGGQGRDRYSVDMDPHERDRMIKRDFGLGDQD